MSKDHSKQDLFHGHKGCGCQTAMLSEAVREAGLDPSRREFLHGDAAVQQMIDAVRKAQARYGKKDLRPVLVHAQAARHDQVDAMAELGITPSFFPVHTFLYGDTHINHKLGRERAFHISPSAYAKRKGIPFTIHTDAPVVPPNTLFLIGTAVNWHNQKMVRMQTFLERQT